jgi:hypothetical protein
VGVYQKLSLSKTLSKTYQKASIKQPNPSAERLQRALASTGKSAPCAIHCIDRVDNPLNHFHSVQPNIAQQLPINLFDYDPDLDLWNKIIAVYAFAFSIESLTGDQNH